MKMDRMMKLKAKTKKMMVHQTLMTAMMTMMIVNHRMKKVMKKMMMTRTILALKRKLV